MVKRYRTAFLIFLVFIVVVCSVFVYAAVGCRLNNPDQDIARVFPESSNYRTHFVRIAERGGEKLFKELERRLGERWDPVWETADVPYAYYEVLKGQKRIGWVFGANQGYPGADNAQIILVTDENGRIRELFFQKLPSLEKEKFQNRDFYRQFVGLTIQHFYIYEALKKRKDAQKFPSIFDPVGRLRDPSKKEHEGFKKILRGVKKVLLLFDEFWSEKKIDKDEVFRKVERTIESSGEVVYPKEPLKVAKRFFEDSSKVICELLSPRDGGEEFVEEFRKRVGGEPDDGRDGSPLLSVALVYGTQNYEKEFVRGELLGYLLFLPSVKEGENEFMTVAVDEKGKIRGFSHATPSLNGLLERVKGMSLTNFYVNEAFERLGVGGGKVDRLGAILESASDKKVELKKRLNDIKKALVLIDEFYLNNYYKKEKVFKLVEEYLKKKR